MSQVIQSRPRRPKPRHRVPKRGISQHVQLWRCEAQNLPLTEVAYEARLEACHLRSSSSGIDGDPDGCDVEVSPPRSWAHIVYLCMIFVGIMIMISAVAAGIMLNLWTPQ